jgi:hypothetical protein
MLKTVNQNRAILELPSRIKPRSLAGIKAGHPLIRRGRGIWGSKTRRLLMGSPPRYFWRATVEHFSHLTVYSTPWFLDIRETNIRRLQQIWNLSLIMLEGLPRDSQTAVRRYGFKSSILERGTNLSFLKARDFNNLKEFNKVNAVFIKIYIQVFLIGGGLSRALQQRAQTAPPPLKGSSEVIAGNASAR